MPLRSIFILGGSASCRIAFFWLLGCWLLVVSCWLLVVRCPSPTTSDETILFPTPHSPLPTPHFFVAIRN
ncbi:MAG TPA: hypothetical protein DD379_15960 [Cyanobacteria bacterium UBA11162]|nr:hypothetical protein [Cyanobacteria bacterium UBA11162]